MSLAPKGEAGRKEMKLEEGERHQGFSKISFFLEKFEGFVCSLLSHARAAGKTGT